MFCISNKKPNDISYIDELLDQAFGVNRFEKTAYRLRDGVSEIEELSFVIHDDDRLIASLQFWPVVIKDGDIILDALLLGPIAIRKEFQGQGHGKRMMELGLAKAKELGHSRVILVGDEPYYRKVGFTRDLARGLLMPGPVDENRLLAFDLVPGSMDNVRGIISKVDS